MTDTSPQPAPDALRKGRFLTLAEVAEELNFKENQIYALVRRGDLEGVKIGGRGQWRVERDKLEDYIQRLYVETRQYIETHPYAELDADAGESAELLAASNPQPPRPGRAGPTRRQPSNSELSRIDCQSSADSKRERMKTFRPGASRGARALGNHRGRVRSDFPHHGTTPTRPRRRRSVPRGVAGGCTRSPP